MHLSHKCAENRALSVVADTFQALQANASQRGIGHSEIIGSMLGSNQTCRLKYVFACTIALAPAQNERGYDNDRRVCVSVLAGI